MKKRPANGIHSRDASLNILFEFINDLIEPRALSFILRAVLAHEVCVVQEGFLLLFLQALRYGDFDFHVQIALAAGLEVRHAFADDAEAGTALRTGRDLELDFFVKGLDLDGAAKSGDWEGDVYALVEIVPVTLEVRIVFDVDVYVEIPLGAAALAGLAFPGDAHTHAGISTGRDIHFDGLFHADRAGAAAFGAFVFDDLAAALTVLAGDDIHHLSERTIPYHTLLAGAVAVGAGLDGGAWLGAGAVAVAAGVILRYGEFLLDTGRCFAKGDLHIIAEVSALLRAIAPSASAAGEHVEDVAHVEAAKATLTAETAKASLSETAVARAAAAGRLRESIVSELVVLGSLIRIGEDVVGFIDFLEFFFRRFWIVFIQIRMVLACQPAICFLDLIVCGAFIDAQHVIVISAVCHSFLSSKKLGKRLKRS